MRRAVKQEILCGSLVVVAGPALMQVHIQNRKQCIPGLTVFVGRDDTLGEESMSEYGRLSFPVTCPLMAVVCYRLPGVCEKDRDV